MASSSSSVEGCGESHPCLYHHWMLVQKVEVFQLNEAIILCNKGEADTNRLNELVECILNNFEEFLKQRAEAAGGDSLSVLAPPWCNSSVLWFGGCKPSAYIDLIHTLCAINYESLSQSTSGAPEAQEQKMDELLRETVTEETELSHKLTSELQKMMREAKEGEEREMWKLIEAADRLRLKTLKSIHEILTPPQMVKFLAVAKKSQICMMK